MYIVRFDIETDGDFYYEDNKIDCEIIKTDDYNVAKTYLIEKLKRNIESLDAKDWVFESVKSVLSRCLDLLSGNLPIDEYGNTSWEVYANAFYFEFDLGNQDGKIYLSPVPQVEQNETVITVFKSDWFV